MHTVNALYCISKYLSLRLFVKIWSNEFRLNCVQYLRRKLSCEATNFTLSKNAIAKLLQ